MPAEGQRAFLQMVRPVRTEHALVRLGGETDGGYLVPDDLDGIVACFSPGVSDVSDFEEALLARGMRTFQIDASIDESPLKHVRNDFERKFLGIVTDDSRVTLDDWVNDKMGDAPGDLIMQIDIEGHEWLAMTRVSDETLRRFRIIVIEFHALDHAFESIAGLIFAPVIERLRLHFDVVHLHANNVVPPLRGQFYTVPPFLELTLLRKDRSRRREPVTCLPHPLDRDNVTGNPAAVLHPVMYKPESAAFAATRH